jgi:histidinol phosphatase-like PHP family hydrolase
MIDLHTHTLFSDGVLLPSELARRAQVAGYEAIAFTDHVDHSNLAHVLENICRVCQVWNEKGGIRVIPGVEITHVRPEHYDALVGEARKRGARIVVAHGETLVEPVASGTNRAAIEAGVDIVAHPGLITAQEATLAAEQGVYLEITTRRGHALSNGHVAAMALKHGAQLICNNDAHAPGDLVSQKMAEEIMLGAGLKGVQVRETFGNSEALVNKLLS